MTTEYQGVHPASGARPDMSHNGWTNRATWAVALWLDNDEPLYRSMQAFAREGNVTPDSTRAFVEDLIGPAAASLRDEAGDMSAVDWQEIVDDCVMESIHGEVEDEQPPDLNFEGDPTRNGAFG